MLFGLIDFDQMMEVQRQQTEQIMQMAETLKIMREAIGADTIIGPENMSAYQNQAQNLDDSVS